MAMNPNPGLITDEMWRLWEMRPNPNWKLGGIYANKKGYHNTVNANLRNWPSHYSVQLPLDLVQINRSKARAIDLTMSDSEMIKWTGRMIASALDPHDHRLAAVKEFYGTLDGVTVVGYSKDTLYGPWEKSHADSTHLWHSHTSIFTAFVAAWHMLSPFLSVWRGESFEDWQAGALQIDIAKEGDIGEGVKYFQSVHNLVRETVSPPSPKVEVDGQYGPKCSEAFYDFWKKNGGESKAYKGTYITGWLATRYHMALARVSVPKPQAVDPALMQTLVNDWLAANIPAHLVLIGEVKGSVQLPQ